MHEIEHFNWEIGVKPLAPQLLEVHQVVQQVKEFVAAKAAGQALRHDRHATRIKVGDLIAGDAGNLSRQIT